MELSPLPGDPGVVTDHARRMQEAANRMQAAAGTLRRLTDSLSYRSDAVDALRANAGELKTVMHRAATRYRGAGEALADYAPALDHAQKEARAAIRQLSGTDVGRARHALHEAQLHATAVGINPLASEEERLEREAERRRAEADLEAQEAVAASARAMYAGAQADLEHAARVAAQRIVDAENASGLNDRAADKFRGWKDRVLLPILDAVQEAIDRASKLLLVVTIITACIPGLQVVAAVAFFISKALDAIEIVATLLQGLLGEISLGAALVAIAFLVMKFGKRRPPTSFAEGMGPHDGARYIAFSMRDSHPQIGKMLFKSVADPAEDAAEDIVQVEITRRAHIVSDAVGLPSVLWTPHDYSADIASHDVAPVGEVHRLDASSIVEKAFRAPQPGTPVECSLVSSGRVPSGGGGGW